MSPSPNFGPRRDGLRPELVVIHYTAMATAEAAERVLCDPEREVSAHYLIDENGVLTALVDEEMRAWHAGAGTWAGRGDVNSRSIGIELANNGFSPFAARQMEALEDLLKEILPRWNIPPEGVIAHSDMAPERKRDPGPRFDWLRLSRQGLSVWPSDGFPGGDVSNFLSDAKGFGYPDLPLELVLQAVRLRFRPWAKGPLDPVDAGLVADLARRFPVDRARATA
ncbi:N-acetylmuramoyl-L-alanine amidase [Rhodobacterales bacterium HKCCE2091]|nr:N-acetylmuramoyl-L-alanine amidase [Rhodobacterales bacterium HKCCE2091]